VAKLSRLAFVGFVLKIVLNVSSQTGFKGCPHFERAGGGEVPML
jgi:hypothetical protein